MNRKIRKPEITVPSTTHYSVIKAADALKIKVVYADLNENFKVNTGSVSERLSKNTIAIVGNVGSTELGLVDDIEALPKIAREKQCRITSRCSIWRIHLTLYR